MAAPNPTQEVITTRQLVLAREMYLHALEHSTKGDRLGNMIAVHNFHNAIEIVLNAIFDKYQIPIPGNNYPNFPDLIKAINGFQPLKDKGKQLPYDQDIRDLNRRRNDVQHDAVEPPPSTMERWRVIVQSFLEAVTKEYFDRDFELLSVADLIDDPKLRALMQKALELLAQQRLKDAMSLVALAFSWASRAPARLAENEVFDDSSRLQSRLSFRHQPGYRQSLDPDLDKQLVGIYEKLINKMQGLAGYVGLIASGVNLAEYERFRRAMPKVDSYRTLYDGKWQAAWYGVPQPDLEVTTWAANFVTETIVSWQVSGLDVSSPSLSEADQQDFEEMLSKINMEDEI